MKIINYNKEVLYEKEIVKCTYRGRVESIVENSLCAPKKRFIQ